MYNEVNGFELYKDFFYFPLDDVGVNMIVISCEEGGRLYPENNPNNSIECVGPDYDVQFTIDTNIEPSSQLILEGTTGPTSFGEISIFLENSTNSGSTITESSIFSSVENMQQFYIYEFAFIIVFLILIFFKKFFNKLG